MPYVALDSALQTLVQADALAPDWNGWAQPRWRSIVVLADAVQRMMPDAHITFPRPTTMRVTWPEDQVAEVITPDDDGMWTLHGWTFHRAHAHVYSREHGTHVCRECSDAEGMIMSADDCTADLSMSDDAATEAQYSRH
jgi:hypothetical protein